MNIKDKMKNLRENRFGKFNGNEQKYVIEALDSDHQNEKSFNEKFENEFCRKMKVDYAIACNSGTSGLHAAIFSAGICPGDEVINPGLTVVMDAWAIIHQGGTPIFADIDPDTLTINPDDVRKKVTKKTKAIIVVSLQGLSVDIDPIMDIADEHGLVVIEDSAQNMLGKYKGRLGGTLGHIGVFSFENKKHMTCGSEGGMIVTNNEKFAIQARKFSGLGYKHMTATAGRTSLAMSTVQDPGYERFDTVGLNYRMNEISAAVGLAQLERIEEIVALRKESARLFRLAVKDCEYLVEQSIPSEYEHSHYTFTIKYTGEKITGLSWKDFYNQYIEMGGDGFYGACKVPYLEPAFKDLVVNNVSYNNGICPVAEKIQPQIMQFKTNYRDLDIAEKKAKVLHDLINKIGK
tara:strand:- start:35 stop:1249 length:1215 start_codon:yes stop_codon:yes gene_type:complete